jgi:antagonist of KipI
LFAITGGDFEAELDGVPIRNWSSLAADPGSVLKFRGMRSGARSYIAVHGGFEIEEWLNSASTNLTAGVGGFFGRKLKAGDSIGTYAGDGFRSLAAGSSMIPHYSRFPTVRIVAGSEFELLSPSGERTFLNEGFSLTNDCDRMGFRLVGQPLELLHNREMVSAAVTFGTIQLLPDGQLIVLMADHQTSGGYPRIGAVISVDLPLMAQCRPGDGVGFARVSVEEAERLASDLERELNYLGVGCRLQGQNANR